MGIFLEVIANLLNRTLNFLYFLLLFHKLKLSLISLLCLLMLEYINLIFQSMLQFFVFPSVFSHFLFLFCGLYLKGSVLSLYLVNFRSQHNVLILKRGNNFRILIIDIHYRRGDVRSNGFGKQSSMRYAL